MATGGGTQPPPDGTVAAILRTCQDRGDGERPYVFPSSSDLEASPVPPPDSGTLPVARYSPGDVRRRPAGEITNLLSPTGRTSLSAAETGRGALLVARLGHSHGQFLGAAGHGPPYRSAPAFGPAASRPSLRLLVAALRSRDPRPHSPRVQVLSWHLPGSRPRLPLVRQGTRRRIHWSRATANTE